MKRILHIVFIFVFAYSHTAHAAGFDSSYKATRVSWTLKDILSREYALDISHLHKEDREYLELLRSDHLANQVSKLKISVRGNLLVLNFENKAAAVLEIEADRILLNGKPLKLNPEVSITQNLRNWGLRSKETASNVQPNFIWDSLIPQAHASPITDQASEVAGAIISTGVDAFETYASTILTSKAAAATVASGSAATIGSALIITTATVVAALAVVAVVACEAEAGAASTNAAIGATSASSLATAKAVAMPIQKAKSQERLNCYSKPLSSLNINPRDRMHAQNITCSHDKTAIDFESQTHKKARIELTFKGNKLSSVTPNTPDLREQVAKQARYYQLLCKDTEALQAFRNAVAKEKAEGKVFTRPPSDSATGVK